MTKITANIILIIMLLTWAIISLHEWKLVEVSSNFLWLAGILASGHAPDILVALQSLKQVKQ